MNTGILLVVGLAGIYLTKMYKGFGGSGESLINNSMGVVADNGAPPVGTMIDIGGGNSVPFGSDTEYGRSVLNFNPMLQVSEPVIQTIQPGYLFEWQSGKIVPYLSTHPRATQAYLDTANIQNQRYFFQASQVLAAYEAQQAELRRIGFTNIT